MYYVYIKTKIFREQGEIPLFLGGDLFMGSIEDYISIMIHQTDLNLTNYIKAQLIPLNIAPEQNLILMLLYKNEGLSQNEIAGKLNKDKTNIARMLSNLEKKGLIRRRINEVDGRSFKVSLTEEGEKLEKVVFPIVEEFNQVICSGITIEELHMLRQILSKMRKNVEDNNK